MMHEILTYEDSLNKSQRVNSDDDWNTLLFDCRIEENLEMMQKTICDISLINEDIWCIVYMT